MSYLDAEIQRLKKYSEGLGLNVSFKKFKKGDPGATYDPIGQDITIYTWSRQTKTTIILNFLHELGHHFDWVYNMKRGVDSSSLTKALELEWSRTKRTDPVIPKRLRKLIYEMEKCGIVYMDSIAKELDLKIPMWRIKAEQEYDVWTYRRYYLTGNHPTSREAGEFRSQLMKKWRGRA